MEEQPTNLSNNDNDEIKIKLKHILETSKCNHKIEIMKQPNIKKHIYIVKYTNYQVKYQDL